MRHPHGKLYTEKDVLIRIRRSLAEPTAPMFEKPRAAVPWTTVSATVKARRASAKTAS